MTNINDMIKQRIRYNKRKVKDVEKRLDEATASSEAAKLVCIRFYHLGAAKQLTGLLDDIKKNKAD